MPSPNLAGGNRLVLLPNRPPRLGHKLQLVTIHLAHHDLRLFREFRPSFRQYG